MTDDFETRTLAHMRANGHPMSDLPDEVILKSYTFAHYSLGLAMREFANTVIEATGIRRLLERLAR